MSGCSLSTPPSRRSGGVSGAGTCATCPQCCGCVSSAAIGNVQSFTVPPIDRGGATVANGHSFDFVIQMAFTAGGGGGAAADCTLEWWERVDLPAVPGHAPNTWTDMFALVPTSPTFNPWTGRVVPCPTGGNLTVTIVDIPSLGTPPGVTQTRTLEFRLVVNSGAGCTCAHTSATARARQALQMVNGSIVAAGTSFTIL